MGLDVVRASDDCRTAVTFAFDVLVWTALLSSGLGFMLGVIAVAARTSRVTRALVGLGLSLIVGVLVFVPGVGMYVCGDSAA